MASSDYKKFNREIKGYVEISYDIGYFDTRFPFYIDSSGTRQTLAKKEYSEDFASIANSDKNKPEYAMLYNNFTKLDGSFMLFNKTSNNCGYIAEYTPKEIYDTYHTSGIEDSGKIGFYMIKNSYTSGITIYTRNNKIKNATIDLTYATQGVVTNDTIIIEDNDKDILFIELDNTQESTQISITVDEWEDENMLVNMLSVDGGLSYIYEGNELIDLEITEEVNKLVEETPNNELKLTVGDYERLYDPLNPKGIAKYLTEGSKFIPYIGIRTEDGSFDYDKMGTFYFNKIDYNEKEVTFTCYNLMNYLSSTYITNNSGNLTNENHLIPKNGLTNYLTTYLQSELNNTFIIDITNKIRMSLGTLKRTSFAEFLQKASMIDGIFYVDRNNNIVIKNIDNEIKDNISKNELLNDIRYTNVEKVKAFNLQRNVFTLADTSETNDTDNFVTTFTLEEDEPVICVTSDDPVVLSWLQNYMLNLTGASDFNIIRKTTRNDFNFMLFVRIYGSKGDTVTLSGKYPYKKDSSSTTEVDIIGSGEPLITIDNPFYSVKYYTYDDMFTNFFNKAYSYKVNLEYNGNTKIKAGDYINVESNYGIVPIFVQRHTLKYNGGLSGSIEGVE